MTLADSIQGVRLRTLELAKQLDSVTEACEQLGISRSLFYRWRKRFESYGPDGLHPKRIAARPGRPSIVTPEQERAVIALALAGPSWGPQRLADSSAVKASVWLPAPFIGCFDEWAWAHVVSAWASSNITAHGPSAC